jgi:hypothetical protein
MMLCRIAHIPRNLPDARLKDRQIGFDDNRADVSNSDQLLPDA